MLPAIPVGSLENEPKSGVHCADCVVVDYGRSRARRDVSRMSARVSIGRPDLENRRAVLVDGRPVGVIRPDSSGVSSSGRRGRHSRLHGWIVDVPPVVGAAPGEAIRHYRALRLRDAENWARTSGVWPVEMWVYMSGSHGCLPDSRGCVGSRDGAVECLLDLFELSRAGRRGRELAQYGSVELGPRWGADYCEVAPCSCPGCSRVTVRMVEEGWECDQCAG